ncbi:MAG: glycosyltransferase [Rhodobacteraceae bacterium]|nr:glycosyltransferase [Paracoccaceae bacterium]
MKISVITAVLNREATLVDAICSVQRQVDVDVEHIIQDGGSTDGTLEIIKAQANATTQLVSEPDAGIYDAINRGIARASGAVIGVMHSDDFYAHDGVLAQVAAALADPALDGVYGDLDYVSARDPNRVLRHWRAGPYTRGRLARGWMPPHPTLYLRREVFERWGAYDTSFRISADYEAMLRWLSRGEITLGYIPRVLVRMRMGGESNRSLGRIALKSREDLRALRRNRVGGLGALALKNTSKLGQFISRDRQDT